MKAKHAKATVKKRAVAKRAVALVFAAVLLCGCLLSVFASDPSLVDTIKDAADASSDAGSIASDTGRSSTGYMDDFATYYKDNIAFKQTYRFWLQESDELAQVKAGTLALSDCTDFYQELVYTEGDMREQPSGFETPIDTTGKGRAFEGWYYYDSDGKEQTFEFDGLVISLTESSTVDVFAKWGSATADADSADSAKKDAESTKADETKTSDSTTSDAQKYQKWYDEIMACEDIDQLAELYEKYVLDDGFVAYVDTLSSEKQQALSDKLNVAQDVETATYNITIEHVSIICYHYTKSNQTVSAPQTLGEESATTEQTVQFKSENYNSKVDNYWLFFIKPETNYMVTGLGTTGNGDVYSTANYANNAMYGNIKGYPNLEDLVKDAYSSGYVGVFGYSRTAGQGQVGTQKIEVEGKQPSITVAATSDKTKDVKPGDKLTFTVTITPGHTESGRDQVKEDGVKVTELTINGQTCSLENLTPKSDGTYTGTVQYTATDEDCEKGYVQLDVTASVDYTVKLGVSDTSGVKSDITTSSTITSSAGVTCFIAPKSQVTYVTTVASNAPTENRPEVVGKVPHDTNSYYVERDVTVDTTYPEMTSVWDATNGGVWTFDGWYLGDRKVTTAQMTDAGLTFTGTWSFTKTTSSFTIAKQVTGNMGDLQKEFDFTVTVTDNSGRSPTFKVDGKEYTGTANNIKLKHDGSVTLTNVPIGATVTITEGDSADGYETSAKLGDTTIEGVNRSFTFTVAQSTTAAATASLEEDAEAVPELVLLSEDTESHTIAEGNTVTIINNKEIEPPTGVLLDTLPYILLLAAVGMGTVVQVVRRRNRPLRHG